MLKSIYKYFSSHPCQDWTPAPDGKSFHLLHGPAIWEIRSEVRGGNATDFEPPQIWYVLRKNGNERDVQRECAYPEWRIWPRSRAQKLFEYLEAVFVAQAQLA